MSQQPYYFELVTRNMITRINEKDQGHFKFYIHKNSQKVDASKAAIKAVFSERCMQIQNLRLNFFLPNYLPGKNYNSKFILSLTQKIYNNQEQVGSYTIDPNIYIEQYKRNGQNHFAQIWELSEDYSVEVEMFFDESKYALEKLLRQYNDHSATSFSKPLVSKALEQAKKAELEQQDKLQDDAERYNNQRMKLLNKYAGALVGHGGYRILNDQSQNIVKKQSQLKRSNNRYETNRNQPISTSSITKHSQDLKNSQNSKNQLLKQQQKTPLKQAAKSHNQEDNSQGQMKNIKFLIIGILILILLGSGYFLSKIFLKEDTQSIQVPKTSKQNKMASGAQKKSKAKTSKNSQQL